jgi:hypothetical protein
MNNDQGSDVTLSPFFLINKYNSLFLILDFGEKRGRKFFKIFEGVSV